MYICTTSILSACRDEKRLLCSLEHTTWVLRIEPRSSKAAASALNHCNISPAPKVGFLASNIWSEHNTNLISLFSITIN